MTKTKGRTLVLFDDLRHELRSFPATDVETFIGSVVSATDQISAFRQWADEGERARRLLKMQRLARAYLRDGFPAVLARPYPARISRTSPHTLAIPDRDARRFYEAREAAHAAVETQLREIELALKSVRKKPRGQPSADHIGLLARIAHCYLKSFGKRPTSTPGSAFANVAALVLRYQTGKNPRDVSRQVRAAIRSF